MSYRSPRSRNVKFHRRTENRLAPNGIVAPLDGAPRQQIDFTAEDLDQVVAHVHVIEQRPVRIRREPHQHIHIAIRAKLLRPGHATEQRKLRHLPLPAELPELLLRNLDRDHAAVPWHFLYFFPEPHGQGSLRPTFASFRFTVCGCEESPPEKYIGCCVGLGGGRARCTRCTSSSSPSRCITTSVFQRYFTTRSWMRSIISVKSSNDSFLYSTSGSRWPQPGRPIPSLRWSMFSRWSFHC